MQDSKLILLLKTFEKEDWRWFKKFLQSPYFNNRKELLPFFEYLRGLSPDFKPQAIKKEKVFKKLFPDQPYDEKQISYVMNFLLNLAERFLAQRALEEQRPLVQNYLLKSLVDRQLDKHYNYQYSKAVQLINECKSENIDYYFFEYQLAEIANVHFDNQNLRKYSHHLQATSDSLDQFYLLSKIKCCCEMLIRSKVVDTAYQPALEQEIIQFIESEASTENELIRIYLEAYYILKKENAEIHFENLKNLLESFKEDIPFSEKRKLHLYGINYCIAQIGKSNKPRYYVEQCLDLYLTGIDQEFLLNKGYLTPWTFKNVIKLGLNLKRYDFTETFIQKYHTKLEEEYQEDALHFNLADINYRKKKYQEAQIHLIQVQFSDVFYNLGAKAMLLKIYYETRETEALFSLLASFSIYLKRNKKLAKDIQESYLDFTAILSKIVRARKDRIPAIIDRINSSRRLYNRNWLLEICKEY